MKGVEDYFAFSSHSAGAAGSGSVNLATGALTLAIPTLSTTDSLMPYTPTLVYNSALANKYYTASSAETGNTVGYMPYGFKLNICETVIQKSYTDVAGTEHTYFVYADADGTEHSFSRYNLTSEVYYDDSGLQKVLCVLSDGSVIITDDSKITKTFTKKSTTPSGTEGAWYLTKITDVVGNSVIFTFDTSNRPSMVSLKPNGSAQIDFLNIYYYTTGRIKMVYNSESKDAVVFRYSDTYYGSVTSSSSKYLRQIDYAHGSDAVTLNNWDSFASSASSNTNITVTATAKYTYNSSGLIENAKDETLGQYIKYAWSSTRVGNITHYAGTTQGQKVEFSYNTGYTDVLSSGSDDSFSTADDITTRYVFDEYGRAVSMYSYAASGTEFYGATVGKYETQEEVKNNLKEQTVIGNVEVNYLLNGDFGESTSNTSINHWTLVGAAQKAVKPTNTSITTVKFTPASGATASLTQYVRLKAGKYTLSIPYDTVNCESATATVSITSVSGSGFYESKEMSLSLNNLTGRSSVFSTTFEIEAEDILNITVSLSAEALATTSPELYVYNLMLEKGIGASEFSMVSYGSFEESVQNSSGTLAELSDYWTTESGAAPETVSTLDQFETKAKIVGSVSSEKYIKQRIFEKGYESGHLDYNEYKVSGFASSGSAVWSENAKFRIRIDVIYYNGSATTEMTKSYYYDFTPSCSSWQFTGGTFSLGYETEEGYIQYGCVKAIDVYCEYSYQPNGYALFDNISVTEIKSNDVERYYYYESGAEIGLLKRVENVFYEEVYEYDDNRNLTRVANNDGEITDYYYTESGLVDSTESYDFKQTVSQSKDYPYWLADPDSVLTKTPKTKTNYIYDGYGLCYLKDTYPIDDDGAQVSGSKSITSGYIYKTASGSKIFGAVVWEYDSLGTDILYYYDENNGRLLAVINKDENTGTAYTYDAIGNLTSVRPATYVSETSYTTNTNAENVTYTYNAQNLLSTIITESTTYTFAYDVFGNTTSVNAGDNTLSNYEYNSYNGKLKKVTYGNGYVVEYEYNDIELLSKVWYTVGSGAKTLAYEYEYTSDGQVHKLADYLSGRTTVYTYDANNRLTGFVEYENDELYHYYSGTLSYNDKGQLSATNEYINFSNGAAGIDGANVYHFYSYKEGGALELENVTTPKTSGSTTYTYDVYNRVTKKRSIQDYLLSSGASSGNEFDYTEEYTFSEYSDNTSAQIKTFKTTVNGGTPLTYTYTYDQNGNITKIVYSTGEEITYTYDDLGQLIREDNGVVYFTYIYEYDKAGNIMSKFTYDYTSPGQTPSFLYEDNYFSYSSEAWGDQLISNNGDTLTYDELGNPLTYYSNDKRYTFSWEGRRLVSSSIQYGLPTTFTYNSEGIRTSKTHNGVTTTYYLDGNRIVGEETQGNVTLYIYDASGAPIGMQYHGASYAEDVWDVFWYEKNLQGDIVAIYDESGTLLITYTYNAWGEFTTMTHNGGYSTAAYDNPFTYRGYYYEESLFMYYLGSRYYDQRAGRFISADGYISTGQGILGNNMYAYCGNNPVMRVDPTGEAWWHWAIGGAIVLACAAAVVVTAGGATPAIAAVAAVASGTPAATTASTVAAGAFIGASFAYGSAVAIAAANSNSIEEFNEQGDWGTVIATTVGAVSGGIGAYSSTRTSTTKSTTKIYRSVSNAEAQDIKNTGRFNLSPTGMECKQFGFNLSETRRFGNMVGQNIIVKAKIPTAMLNQFCVVNVDTTIFRNGTLTVYADQLKAFNQAVSGTIKIMY